MVYIQSKALLLVTYNIGDEGNYVYVVVYSHTLKPMTPDSNRKFVYSYYVSLYCLYSCVVLKAVKSNILR